MNVVVVGCLVLTFIFDIGAFYGCCGLSSTFIPNIGGCEVCHIVCCFGMYIIKFLNVGNIWVAKIDGESG
jgi:hypothetical protein